MIFDKIKTILAEQLDVDEETLTMETDIAKDLNADSLDVVEILMTLEDEFSVEIPDEEIENIDRNSDNYVTGVYFMDLINELEKMGDFIINVSQDLLKYKLKVTKL